MSIKKQKNGFYQVRKSGRVHGRIIPKKKSNIPNLGSARQIEREFTEELKKLQAKAKMGIIFWSEALTEFDIHSEKIHSASTRYNQMTTLKEYTADWAKRELKDFNPEFIRFQIDEKMKNRSVSTKNNLAKFIRNVFELQISKGKLQVNPGKGVRFDDGGLKKGKLTAMSRTEVLKLLDEVSKVDEKWYLIFRVTYELGLRSGEAYALKKKHFNFETNRVTIIESYCSKSKTEKVPKNREYRLVPLNKSLIDLLAPKLLEMSDDDFVLPRVKMWKHGEAAKILRSYQRQYGIKETNFHSLRASFITHLINENVPLPQIQAMVGHADLKTTQAYIRLDRKDLDGATDVLSISKKND